MYTIIFIVIEECMRAIGEFEWFGRFVRVQRSSCDNMNGAKIRSIIKILSD